MGEVSNSFFDKLLSGEVALSLVEEKTLGPSLGRGSAFDRFDPNAWDGDGDGLVQEGTAFERPAIPGINTDLPNVPKVPQVPVSNNKEVLIYDEISGSSRSMRAGINTARFPRLKRRNKRNPDLDIPQIIKEKTGTVDDGEASKRLSIQLKNLESQFTRGVITVEEYNMQRLASLSEYNYERSIEQSATKAGIEIPREISGIGATGEDGNVVGFVNLIRFSSMHNGIRYLHNSGDDEMLTGTRLNETDQYVGRRYPGELRTEEARTLEDMNEEYEELLQQLRDGRGWDAPLEVSIGFSFEQEIEILRESAGSQLTNQSFKNELYLENEEIPKYLAGIAYSMERALSEQVGGENFEGKIDIAVADRIAKLLSKSWVMKDSYKELNPHWGEIYDFNMSDIFSPEERIPGLPYFHPSGLGESGKNLDTAFMFPFDKDGADIPVVIKRGLRVHEQRTFLTGGKEFVLTRYFFDTHRPEVFETEVVDNPLTSGEGKRRSNDRKLRWEFFPNTEQPKFQVGKIEGPVSKSMGVTLLLDRNTRYGAGSNMDLRVFPFRITQDGIPYRFEPSFSIDEQPAIKRINEFLKKIGIPETRASNTDSLYVPSEFDPRYLVVNGPLETPGKTEERPKSYLDKLREAAVRDRGESADLKIDVDMASALLKKQSIRQTDDEETVSVWVSEELVADNASIDASRREPQTPPSITPPKKDMAQRIREGKIRKNLGLSDDEEIPPGYGGDNSRSKRNTDISTGDFIGDEELDPDLKYYINDSNGFPVLQHPLVYAVPYMPQLNNMYNRQYLAKKEQLANALDTGDWDGYVYLHERPYRLDALLEISDDVDDATFWSLLSGIWTDSENIRQNQEIWNEIFDSGRDGMENMMKDEERDALAALPKKIKIYQGHTGDRDDGWSWTTDEKVALWFALRFSKMEGSEAQVTEATVDKDNVLAYLLGRGESEILTSPEDVVIDVTESAKDFQERTGTPNTYDGRSLSKRVNSLLVDSLTITEFIDDFNQNDKDSSKLAESLGIDSTEPVDKLIHNLVNLGLIKDVPSFDSSRSKRSNNKSADKERALKRFMMLSDDEVVALFKENDGSGTNVRVSLGNPNEKEFYARIEKMKKSGIIFPERKVKKKNDENVGSSSKSKKEIYSFTPESDIAEQIKDRKELKKKASKEIGRITASTRKREEIREITSRIEEKIKSLSDITDSSALSEHEDEIDALSIELQSMLNNITSFIPTNRGRFKPYVSVYGRTAFSDEPSSSHLEIRLDYLTESAESGSWPSRTMYGDLYIASDGEKFIRKSASRDNGIISSSIKIHVDTEKYFDAFQDSIFSAMGVKKFKQEASSPRAIFYAAFDGLHWADERSKEDFLKAVEWISKQKSIEMSADKRKELARLIKIARSQKLDSPNAFKPEIFLRDYDAINALGIYQRAEFEGRADDADDAYMSIDFTGDIISPDDTSGGGYYFGESSDGSSRSKRKKISLERRKKLTAEAEKLSAPYLPSTRKREEIRAKMDEVRNNVKYYKENPEELNDFIYDIFTRDLKPDEDLEEQFIINLDGKDYELFFGTDVSIDSRTGNLEITLARIPEGAVDGESVLKPGIYKIQIDDNGNMTAVKDMAEIGDMVPSLVMLRGEGELENFTKLNKAMNLIEESILSAMGIDSFTQNATAYRGESGSMRTGISLSLAEGRTFADKEGKEIFLKIIDSITKNTEIDSDTRERLKALHDRAKKNNLGVNNAVQPQDFVQGSLSENYDLEKGIRDFLNDEKNGMRMLSIDFVKKIDGPDVYRFGGDSSRSIRLPGRDTASLTPETRKWIRERAERNTAMRLPSSRKREEINSAASKIHDTPYDEVSRGLNDVANLIKTSVEGKFQVDGKPVRLEVIPSSASYLGKGSGETIQGITMRIRNDNKGDMMLISRVFYIYFNDDGSIEIYKNFNKGDGTFSEGKLWSPGEGSAEMLTELTAALESIEKSIFSALGAKEVTALYQSYAKPDGEGNVDVHANGITFAAENNLDWAHEGSKEKFLDVFESALGPDSFLSGVKIRELRELIEKSRKEKFGGINNVRPINFMKLGIDTDRLFAEYSIKRNGVISAQFTEKLPEYVPYTTYRFGGDSSRSIKLRGRDTASLTPETRKWIRERAERNTAMRLPSTRQRKEINSIANEISELQKMGTDEDRAFGIFIDEDMRNKVEDATRKLGELIEESIIGKMTINGRPVKLEVSLGKYRPIMDGSIQQDVVMFTRSGDGLLAKLLSRRFGIIFKKDGSISIRKNDDAGDSTIENGDLGSWKNQEMRTELSAAMKNIEKNIASAIGAKTMTARHYSSADRDEFDVANVVITANGVSFAADSDFDWATEEDKQKFLDIIEWSADSLSTARPGRWGVLSEEKSNELKNLVEKSRKEKFGNHNAIRPSKFSNAINLSDLLARYSLRSGKAINIDFTEKLPDGPDVYRFGGDSSRSKRSLEIVEFNAPAPSKKQIKAIGELKNIVSDDRKDYRLFSDEEGNVPKQIFDGSFEINGEKYSSQIDKSNIFVSQVTDGSVEKIFKFSGKVLDKDGNEVASFSRGIKFVDGRPVHVTHDGLYVRYASQNIGISTALNARNEKLYREIGVPKIVVNATSSGDGKVRGITHWLRNGYSWDDSASRKLILNIIDKALTEGAIKDKEQESAVRKIRESIRENIANLNGDINLEDLVNWDGVDEWFMSYADSNDEYERGKTLYANLSKNLNLSETSSRSKSAAVPVAVSKNGNFLKIKYGDFEFDIRNPESTDNNWANAYEKLLSWEGSYYSRIISSALLGLEPPMAHGGKGPKAKLAEAVSAGSSKGLSNYDISDFRQAVYDAYTSIERVRNSPPTVRPLYRGMVVENDSSIVDSSVGDTFSMPLTSFTYVELGAKEFAGGSFNSPESVEGTPILVVLEKGAKAADSPNGSDMFPDGYLDSIDDGDGGLVRVPMESVTQGKFKIVGKKKIELAAGEGWEIRIEQLDTYEPMGSRSSRQTNPPVSEWAREVDISRPIKEMNSLSNGGPGMDTPENSSRSEKYLKIAERINSATRTIEDNYQIIQVETEQEMDDLRSIWEKSKKEVKSLKKEITDSKDTDDLKEFNMTYKRFEEASRMIDKALDPYYLSPYTRSRGDKSWVEHFVIHDGGKYGGIFGGVASVRWAPLTETIYIDFMGSTPLLMPGIGTALYGKILKWGRDMGAKKYVSGALPGSLSFWEEMGMTRSDKYKHSFEDNGLIPMVYEDNGIGMIDKLN